MKPSKGHYCLVQYCDDLSRMECVNVGVLLFCPERGFIGAKMAESNDRIRRVFGAKPGLDLTQVDALKASIEERLKVETISSMEQLEAFIASRGNEIQITAPRPVKVFNPEEDLQKLFNRLVGGVPRQVHTRAKKDLDRYLRRPDLEPKLQKDVTVMVPAFHKTLTVPYGFQNGRFNLIQPARFERVSTEAVINRACKLGVEGQSLANEKNPQYGDVQLVVVGFFEQTQSQERQICKEIFDQSRVRLYTASELPRLVDEILTTAKPLPGKFQQEMPVKRLPDKA